MPDEFVTREVFGNIDGLSKTIFYALATVALSCFVFGVYRRARLWRRGQADDRSAWRFSPRRFFINVVGQRSFQHSRLSAGWAHKLLFGGFGVLTVGTILIAIEHCAASAVGREPTEPLFHKGVYFAVYEFVLDTAGLALLGGCCWFLIRRLRRSSSIEHGPLDLMVLSVLVLLGVSGYLAEGLRIIREQTPQPAYSYVGLGVARVFEGLGVTPNGAATLHFAWWWAHAILALGFIAAFPYTRLLHAIAGALNLSTGFERLGVMHPLSIEDVETTGLVGVASIQDFTRRQLLKLDACVSCGRCQDACPAHDAGKPLSPRDVVQDLRHHLSGLSRNAKESSEETLGERISLETLWSCTTCHACVETCPLGVDPLGFITDLRRNVVAEGHLHGAPAASLQKMQRSGNPWGLPAAERWDWAEGLDVPRVEERPDFEVLYWVGCAASYDRRTRKVARAVVRLLQAADVDFAVLGPEERCTGESARRMGEEFLFQELAGSNLETFSRYSVRKIVTHCPHCFSSFKHDYPQFGGQFEVVHHTQFLSDLIAQGKLAVTGRMSQKIAYHDPCFLARVNRVTAPPRELLSRVTTASDLLIELPRSGRETACCGAGGGRMWMDDVSDNRVGGGRLQEVEAAGAEQLVVGCPFCLTMMNDGLAAKDSPVTVVDIAELLESCIEE